MRIEFNSTLTAAQGDGRELSFMLLPFGEPGQTSRGRITASAGVITVPDINTLELNEEHDHTRPIGKFTEVTETEHGIKAKVRIVETTAGNDAIVLAREGLRTGISVELDHAEIKDGALTSATLTGAALVTRPAFPNARLSATETKTSEKGTNPMNTTSEERPTTGHRLEATESDRVDLDTLTFEALKENGGNGLIAALADQVTRLDNGKVYIRDQEIGELWKAYKVNRPIIEGMTQRTLTSLTVVGRVRNRATFVTDWAGSKAQLPTGTWTTSQKTATAKALAGAVDIGMELVEFGSQDVIADFYMDAMDEYARKSEAKARAALTQGSTKITTKANVFEAVDHAAQTLGKLGARMTTIVVSPDVWSTLVNLKAPEAPWWLQPQARLNLDTSTFNGGGITFGVDDQLQAKTVIVYDNRAAKWYESKEFRYQALNVPQGGVDVSLIRFYAVMVEDPQAVLQYTLTTPSNAS